MKLARAIHLDQSDMNVFVKPARTGEWCISGGFEFSNWSADEMTGKARQAFSNGWLGVETFGRVTFVAVAKIEPREIEQLARWLAQHFVDVYGAPSLEIALPVAGQELDHMTDLCREQAANTMITVHREMGDEGVLESFRTIEPQAAGLEQFVVHGTTG